MRFVKIIDRISLYTGALSAWLIIPLTLVVIYEVAMRHFFNAPTIWCYDASWMIFAAQFLIGGAFTHMRDGHIRIDIVYAVMSDRSKKIYDTLINVIVILPPMVLFGWAGVLFSMEAFTADERLSTTNWLFPSGPPKALIPLGFFLLALQCLAEILRNFNQLKKGDYS
jgi:TRAP-type mannitol/chloroaromatic compound transport system permease small subunit